MTDAQPGPGAIGPEGIDPDESGEIDLDAVVREIEADARERRRSGAYPPAFERELDELFARFAPPAASGDLSALIDAAEEHGLIEPFIPVESQKPAGRYVKLGFAKALGWYHTWLTQEISQFAGASVRALRVVTDRLASIERRLGHADEHEALLARVRFEAPDDAVNSVLVDTLRTTRGRVLVARGGDGRLVRDLVAAGIDAYGVEPDAAARDRADEIGVDLIADDTASHLPTVRGGALSGVVLCGPDIDATPVGTRIALIHAVSTCLANEGTFVIVASAPATFADRQRELADLAAAGPFHVETWTLVLAELGDVVGVASRPIADWLIITATVQRKGG
jgi:hypothetical protein